MKTRDRILAVSLDLFNRKGVANVSTLIIATEMGISLVISIIIFVVKTRLYQRW